MMDGKYNDKETYYSIGGGFIVKEEETEEELSTKPVTKFPFPIKRSTELLNYCFKEYKIISEIVLENEKSLRSETEINFELQRIWDTMQECMYIGCHEEGFLPGGLNVRRRAFDLHKKLKKGFDYNNPRNWMQSIRNTEVKFREILKWVEVMQLDLVLNTPKKTNLIML